MSEDVWLDPEYKKVTCPECNHKWWQKLRVGMSDDNTRCPECKAPLKVRSARLEDYNK